ncbi:hypothetical protein SELMODRAFT_170047 [Selaginella moellendorffii]|uniref:Fatty acid hydroxylase domain-containing protein n=1 Tax=Selaginella moellendorffii TaxID=88036 RepID=D8RBY4_SELML|nr:methylsterol monooxygenase 1-2 [Selaginella moellendorffii]EFJ30871.1 hypothetical protein SELMODRAFT_170047 [Selaginella moellendorffii]|eukprot:XP_002968617.1 methylsterol monooxygenase 1-2 [Selaginella moellendorffii]
MLPYSTAVEAQAALGRPLTFLETLWLQHTANRSDYFLYCLNIVYLFVNFTVLPLPTVILDVLKVRAFERFKLQPGVHTTISDALRCYKSVIWSFCTVVGPLQLLSYPMVKMLGFRTSLPLPSCGEIVSQLAVYFLIEDYGNYWIHRWLHCGWGYKNIHYLHHEFTAPMSFAAPYAHWAEILVLGIPSFVGPALVPGHMVTLWLWIALRHIEAMETHSGYDFPWSFTKFIPFYGGAEYHDYHHFVGGKSQSNFASVFTYCDYLYGTDKGYRYQKSLMKITKNKLGEETGGWVGDSCDKKSS